MKVSSLSEFNQMNLAILHLDEHDVLEKNLNYLYGAREEILTKFWKTNWLKVDEIILALASAYDMIWPRIGVFEYIHCQTNFDTRVCSRAAFNTWLIFDF